MPRLFFAESLAGRPESSTRAAIVESIRKMQDEFFKARERQYAELELLYKGGREMVMTFLVKHEREDKRDWMERQRRAANPAYFAALADNLIEGVYGDPVERALENGSEQQQKLFTDTLDRNYIDSKQRQIGQGQVVLGDAWANIAWAEKREGVAINVVHPSDMWWEVDPDDQATITDIFERRVVAVDYTRPAGEQNVYGFWIVNTEWLEFVDQDGKPIKSRFDNPYNGRLPYARCKGRSLIGCEDGLSVIADQASMQKMLLNRASEFDVLLRYQAFATLVRIGADFPDQVTGPTLTLDIDNPQGDAKYIQPNAPIADVQASIDGLVGQMFETGAVPTSLIRGGSANSGVQLQLEYRPFTRRVQSLRTEAKVFEMDMCELVCIVGAAHGLSLPSDPVVSVKFSDNVLPVDKASEYDRDLSMWTSGLMTDADMLQRWRPDLDTEEKRDAYLQLLAAQKQAKPQEQGQPGQPQPGGFLDGIIR